MDEQQALIDEFLDAVWLSDRLSKNTIDSYRRDLLIWAHWLVTERHCDLLTADRECVQAFWPGRRGI